MDILNHLAVGGNVLAIQRKAEVDELVQMLDGPGHLQQRQQASRAEVVLADPPSTAASMSENTSLPSLGDPFFDEWIADDGLSGTQIMNLADAIQPGVFDGFVFDFLSDVDLTQDSFAASNSG